MAQGNFLFLGDDFIANYSWQQRMQHFEVLSFGVKNERVDGLLQRLSEIEDASPVPDIVLIMTGINNVIDGDYTFVDQIRRMVIRLTNLYPETEIIVNSLPNINVPFLVKDAIHHLNLSINEMTMQTGCCYLDNFALLANAGADIFQKNGIHLTDPAYDKWARSILEYVAFLLEDD